MTVVRTDIQALRGIAVLLVVLYHFDIGPFKAGYLGVDVFFVVSGYLITTLIASGIDRGQFSLGQFYLRRAKRLLPAAYLTILLTAVAAPWFLDRPALSNFALQVLGAVSFTANMVLWQQTDYFAGAAEPLLHMWSLSIEEQYYMLLPAALLLLRRNWWLRAVLLALALSLALCVAGAMLKPVATFYLLPTRAWELLIGSAGALWVLNRQACAGLNRSGLARALSYPGLMVLLVVPAFPLPGGHPGWGALLVCLATLVIILARQPRLNEGGLSRALARVGDISYSLYLVHWPIVAFIKNAWTGPGDEAPLGVRLPALALAFVLAILLYRWVEDPIRRAELASPRRLIQRLGAASLGLVLITPIAMGATRPGTDYQHLRRPNFGLDRNCEYRTAVYAPRSECITGPDPEIMVWGDSYAMHLVPGLVDALPVPLVQATRTGCGPLLNLAPMRAGEVKPGRLAYDQAWARECLAFNRSLLAHLASNPRIHTVILSSALIQYLDGSHYQHAVELNGTLTEAPAELPRTLAALRQTVDALHAMNKKVLLFAPLPEADFNVGACMERMVSGKVRLGAPDQCAISRQAYLTRRADVRAVLAGAAAAQVAVLDFAPTLCDASVCQPMVDGTLIYRDTGHLTYAGSVLLARKMNWAGWIQRNAR